MKPTPLFLLFTCVAAIPSPAQRAVSQPEMAPELQLDEPLASPLRGRAPRVYTGGATGGFTVTPSSREQSRQFYNVIHELSEGTALNWTGSVASCNAGTTSDDFKKAVILRVNYLRAMAGVPANVTLNTAYSASAQQAALIMSANNSLSHSPPPDWLCYTADGADSAAQSNLSLGRFGFDAVGKGQMRDDGANNAAVGHRRWILFPQTQEMGTGDVPASGSNPASNALRVFDTHGNDPRPATREAYVAWPPPGYIPYQLAFARWSFALAGADLSAMSVAMKQGTTNLTVSVEPYTANIGEPARAWGVAGLDPSIAAAPAADTPYTVTVSGVKLGGVTQSPYVYSVTVINPATPGPDTVIASLTGPAALTTGQPGTYAHPVISFAESYDLIEATAAAFSEIEGAENGLANMTANVPAGYDPVSTTIKATGAKSFHLTNPGFQSQSLTWQRTLLPAAASHLQFKSRLGYATAAQTARVQVSKDGGLSWADVYAQAGTSSAPSGFVQKDVSLSSFAGFPVQVRLLFQAGEGSVFTQTDDNVGWFVDDLTVTGASLLTNPVLVTNNTGGTFVYTPATAGQRALYARPWVFQNYPMESGTAVLVTVTAGTGGGAVLNVSSWAITGGQMTLDFTATNVPANPVFKLQTTPDLVTAWADVTSATPQNLGGGNYRFTVASPSGRRQFFRVILN
jgi:hypothetical protein